MSKRTYIGSPHGATDGWRVQLDPKDDLYYIEVREEVSCDCGCPRCTAVDVQYRRHSSHVNGRWPGFEDPSEASETIEAIQEDLDNDYEDYCNENSYEIAQMERYEMWRNEF